VEFVPVGLLPRSYVSVYDIVDMGEPFDERRAAYFRDLKDRRRTVLLNN
jgi:hypothetical protein